MIEPSDRLGRYRWTIERTGAWLGGWRRLRIRYERSSERFYALAMLACAVICFNALHEPHRSRSGLSYLGRSGGWFREHIGRQELRASSGCSRIGLCAAPSNR